MTIRLPQPPDRYAPTWASSLQRELEKELDSKLARNGDAVVGRLTVNGASIALSSSALASLVSLLAPSFGTVKSVGLALPASTFTVSGSPVTTTGTLTGAFATQVNNKALLGPTTSFGSPAVPTWRSFISNDFATSPGVGKMLRSGASAAAATWVSQIDSIGSYYYSAPAAAGTTTINWTTGANKTRTEAANTTYTFTAPPGPGLVTLKTTNSSAGVITITFPAAVKGGTTTVTNAKTRVWTWYFDGTNYNFLGEYEA